MSPITADRRLLYPPDWPTISLKVKEKAGWKCELCGAAHGQPHPITGSIVVLTTHHLDFDPSNCERWNLMALCQRCHNKLDARHRQANREKTAAAKRDRIRAQADAGPLFEPGPFPATAGPVAGGFPGQYAWRNGERYNAPRKGTET
jgi:5-methylcytosine-specific restriction endonuclease McrA